MRKRMILIGVLCLLFGENFSQENSSYFIANTEQGQYLISGKSWLLNEPGFECGAYISEIKVFEGKKYTLIKLFDEMLNGRGVFILDKTGKKVDIDLVQNERQKYYEYYDCCVYVEEYKGKLYFWDLKIPPDEGDYDCYYDSQTDAGEYLIPRYYIYDVEKSDVETVILKNKCIDLFRNGRLNCE